MKRTNAGNFAEQADALANRLPCAQARTDELRAVIAIALGAWRIEQ